MKKESISLTIDEQEVKELAKKITELVDVNLGKTVIGLRTDDKTKTISYEEWARTMINAGKMKPATVTIISDGKSTYLYVGDKIIPGGKSINFNVDADSKDEPELTVKLGLEFFVDCFLPKKEKDHK